MTIQEAQADRLKLESAIKQAIVDFETKYGAGTFWNLTFKRWNGSNDAFGRVASVHAEIRLLDGDSPVKAE